MEYISVGRHKNIESVKLVFGNEVFNIAGSLLFFGQKNDGVTSAILLTTFRPYISRINSATFHNR